MKFNDVYAVDMYANNIIKNYDKNILFSDPQEIPLENLIEFEHGIKIIYANLSHDKSIQGVTIFEDCAVPIYDFIADKYKVIFVNSGSIIIDVSLLEGSEKIYMFTLAHEFAHWLIHYDYFTQSNEIANKTTRKQQEEIEEDADLLALSLLLPRGRVKVAYDRLRHKFKRDVAVRVIADTFNVPVSLVTKRLQNMNLARVY